MEVFENGNLNPRRLRSLYAEFRRWGVQLSDEQAFKLAVEERLFRELKRLENKDADPDQLNTLIRVLETVEQLDINLEFWKSQNLYFSLQQDYEAGQRQFETQAVEQAFKRIGTLLSF